MRELTSTLKEAQQAGALNPLYKIVLTKGESSYTYEEGRILPSEHDEEMYSHRAKIVLTNHDHEFDDKNLKGYDAVISYGFAGEYSATAPLSVIDQQFNSTPGKLSCILELEGMPNLMAEDEASEAYQPDSDDTETVKTLVDAIVGATLAPFAHCHAYEVVWDTGYDPLANTYKPKDSFRVFSRGSRLAALRRVLDYTANVPRFEHDGKCHIMKPVTTGSTFDAEYSLERGSHTFLTKAYRESLTFPNRVVVQSQPGDDPQYSGEAQVDGYDSLPAKVKKTRYVEVRLESDDQGTSMAEALIAKAEMGAARGQAEIRINVASEVSDYVKVTDSRQGDTRTGNLGYIHRRFGPDKWVMTFGFGNWLAVIRYQGILKELETYTDTGQYFPRLQAKDAYIENLLAKNMGFSWIDDDNTIDLSKIGDNLDNLPNGEVYARVKTLHLDAGLIKLDENILYSAGYDPTAKFDLGDNDFDDIPEGTVYQRTKSAALSAAGMVLLDQVVVGTYGLVRSTDISAGHIRLSKCSGDLDDIDDGGTYEKLRTTDIDAGHIKLSSYTVWSGKVTVRSGITINSASGINIWGLNNALTTRQTETGTIQCYVGSDGSIRAGGGDVKLDSNGITIRGEQMVFQTSGGSYRGAIYGGDAGFTIASGGRMDISAYGDIYITGQGASDDVFFSVRNVHMTACAYIDLPRVSSLPSGVEGRLVHDTSVAWGYRLRVFSGGAWRYCQLSTV